MTCEGELLNSSWKGVQRLCPRGSTRIQMQGTFDAGDVFKYGKGALRVCKNRTLPAATNATACKTYASSAATTATTTTLATSFVGGQCFEGPVCANPVEINNIVDRAGRVTLVVSMVTQEVDAKALHEDPSRAATSWRANRSIQQSRVFAISPFEQKNDALFRIHEFTVQPQSLIPNMYTGDQGRDVRHFISFDSLAAALEPVTIDEKTGRRNNGDLVSYYFRVSDTVQVDEAQYALSDSLGLIALWGGLWQFLVLTFGAAASLWNEVWADRDFKKAKKTRGSKRGVDVRR